MKVLRFRALIPIFLGMSMLLGGVGVLSAADIDLRVSVKSIGSDKKGSERTSNRILVIRIDNNDREIYEDVEIEWKVAGRDIKTRKTSVVATGTESVDLPAEEEIVVETDSFSFGRKKGKVERVQGRNGRNDQLRVEDDTGMRYRGYAVVLKHKGKVIAEAGTPGVK